MKHAKHDPPTLDTATVFRRFYGHFRDASTAFLSTITGMLIINDRLCSGSLLLNRLLFLYFLQHTGLLDGDRAYLCNRLRATQASYGENNFYTHFLLPLFHALSERCRDSKHSESCFGNIPALNMRLFDQHTLAYPPNDMCIPDTAFAELFSFFDRYQWKLDDNRQQNVYELHPNILTCIVEQHVDQKLLGAYYTKEDVTTYLAQNTILPYLLSSIEQTDTLWQLVREHPDRYIHAAVQTSTYLPMETEREYAARRTRYQTLRTQLVSGTIQTINDLITSNLDIQRLVQDVIAACEQPEVLYTYYKHLEQMTILDPTCGTGAFLLAALDVLQPIYALCLDRMESMLDSNHIYQTVFYALFQHIEQHPNRGHFIICSILTNNLYGVDIMGEAIERCKQHLLLRLLAESPEPEQCDCLPDLSSHIRVGNTLVGFVHAEEMMDALEKPEDNTGISSRSPFHWFIEFYEVMERGGFDVIIGNPPYVEYSKVKQEYQDMSHSNDGMEKCGNIYAAVIQRSLKLSRAGKSYLGLIVPLSICSGERFRQLRTVITHSVSSLWLANFEIFPSRLFDDAFQRLSMLIATCGPAQEPSRYVTKLQRWYAIERPHLIESMTYTLTRGIMQPELFPKLASPLQETILHNVLVQSAGQCIGTMLYHQHTEYFVYYQEATNYWMKATCSIPFYRKNGALTSPPHGRFLFFPDALSAHITMALMNSGLFYLWFATYSDGFHLSHTLVKDFPVRSDLYENVELPALAYALEEESRYNAQLSTRNTKAGDLIEIEEYRMVCSKPLLDTIDRVIGMQYGFTTEELDYIMHYDNKYRMGFTN